MSERRLMAGFARTEKRPKAAARTQIQSVRHAPVPLDLSLFGYLQGIVNFDPGLGTLYVAGEAGIVPAFSVGTSTASKTGDSRIGPDAHVVGLDPSTHRVYFPLKNVGGRPVLRVMAPR